MSDTVHSYLKSPDKKGMVMLKFLQLAFGAPARAAVPDSVIDPKIEREIVAACSHGNIRIQSGLFVTEDDVEAEFAALKGAKLTA